MVTFAVSSDCLKRAEAAPVGVGTRDEDAPFVDLRREMMAVDVEPPETLFFSARRRCSRSRSVQRGSLSKLIRFSAGRPGLRPLLPGSVRPEVSGTPIRSVSSLELRRRATRRGDSEWAVSAFIRCVGTRARVDSVGDPWTIRHPGGKRWVSSPRPDSRDASDFVSRLSRPRTGPFAGAERLQGC